MKKKSSEVSKRVLESAFSCIAERGCNNVTLREIANRAEVALSQLHYYFNNKEGLFSAVLDNMKDTYRTGIKEYLKNAESGKIGKIIAFNRDLLESNEEIYIVFLEFFNIAKWNKNFHSKIKQFTEDIANTIEESLDDDEIGRILEGSDDYKNIAQIIVGMAFGVSMQYLLYDNDKKILNGFDILSKALQNSN